MRIAATSHVALRFRTTMCYVSRLWRYILETCSGDTLDRRRRDLAQLAKRADDDQNNDHDDHHRENRYYDADEPGRAALGFDAAFR